MGLIEAEERERRRVAELLHDDLQQLLASARMQLQAACPALTDIPDLANVEKLLDESIRKARRLSHELSPPALNHAVLVPVLQWLTRQVREQFGLKVQLDIKTKCQFDRAHLNVFMFRSVQELLFNIVKHANVKSARVCLDESDEGFVISVCDQGKGFNLDGLISQTNRSHKGDGLRVLIADDHNVMRQGLVGLIANQPGVKVVGEAADGRQALEMTLRLQPDVVVMDVSMPEMDGIEATQRIKTEFPDVRVIGLSMHDDQHIVDLMRNAGAQEFLSKSASATELIEAICKNHTCGSA
jgi:CheY-like chemotaxis protein